jgi:uncharacterized cupin superfamily protein
MPNVYEPEFDELAEQPGFSCRGSQIAAKAGSEHLGASLYELPPGQASAPYHWHAANEEMLLVLQGRPTLRTPDGSREIEKGAMVAFPVGPEGAHQILNETEEPVRFIVFSEMIYPEIAVYPDSDKVGLRQHAPGSGRQGLRLNFRSSQALDYWDGETR